MLAAVTLTCAPRWWPAPRTAPCGSTSTSRATARPRSSRCRRAPSRDAARETAGCRRRLARTQGGCNGRAIAPTEDVARRGSARAVSRGTLREGALNGRAARAAVRARRDARGRLRPRLAPSHARVRGGPGRRPGPRGRDPRRGGRRIAECCDAERFDPDALGRAARASGTPVVPLVAALRDLVGGDAAGHVHQGATSQDVMDTAAMLVARAGPRAHRGRPRRDRRPRAPAWPTSTAERRWPGARCSSRRCPPPSG